ncbi:GntR family transcriptional regulator [Streptomyces ipomoeae]|uniref:sigma factor-like helix-turn-helix DNA-binding protein n=1 Tax=Streptomyces ipomoeae TaxID=103232 RepID=UPI0029BC0BA8|nr:sigma factor-like helix-turn-helix DNA-binding protein [Streptomyces ipomoeae]MDX2820029.1 GntR family transcriptional regulator [Streptomyces ipomoeae]MDX2874409.1 GntR family transcriptional regulator [Streptomyces ipomoeae]
MEREAVQGVRQGNGPGGRRLRQGEDIPLTAEQSQRLSALCEQYGSYLVRYAKRKLVCYGFSAAAAETLAEDIAQCTWIEVARTGAKDLLAAEPLSESDTRAFLSVRVQNRLGKYFKRSSSYERPMDFSDPITSYVLAPLVEEQQEVPLAEPSEALLRLLADLPDREREALLLRLDGCSKVVAAERLGCSLNTADRLAETALLRIQLCHPEMAREPVAPESLPAWQQKALATLDEIRREALLRIEDLPRQVLLLHLVEGLDSHQVAARLGVERTVIMSTYTCATSLKTAGQVTMRGTFREKGAAARALTETLRREVEALKPGERVPAERALAARFQCSVKTVRAAMNTLRAEGLVTMIRPYGLFRATAAHDLAVAA